ncbi:MAG: sulfite exporter TauE/SafE family protein [Candidatus Thiodiazotropha sp.]
MEPGALPPIIPLEPTLISLPMALGMGLVFGLGACTLTCLPYLAPVFLAREGGMRQSWRTLLPFSLGRLSVYVGYAGLAGALGQVLEEGFGADWIRPVMGIATLLVGLALLLRGSQSPCSPGAAQRNPGSRSTQADPGLSCTPHVTPAPRVKIDRIGVSGRTAPLLPGGLYLMGVAMALAPCGPLSAVLISAATVGDTGHGLLLGLGFGLGAIALPSLLYGTLFAHLGSGLRERLQNWRPGIERLSALLLIFVGAGNLLA